MIIGKKLAELRVKRGLSQYQLADILSMSRGQIANYEQGSREPDLKTIKKMARYFEVSVDYLLSDEQEEVLTGITFGTDEDRQMMIDIWEAIQRRGSHHD